jgi:hypothetical protein
MKLGAFLKQYLKQSLQAFKHPKQMLPTIILTVVWIILGLLQVKLKENLPMKLLNFITYAQGGLYGGVVSAIGGILGKVVVAGFVNALIVPLFMGKKPFKGLGNGFKELGKSLSLQSRKALAPFLKGFGSALILYGLSNITGSFENSMAGIMAAVSLALAMGKKNGFLWNFACSYAQSVTKGKTPDYTGVLRALTGMTLGFALGVGMHAAGIGLVGIVGVVALLLGWILGWGSKKEAVTTMALIVLTLMPAPKAQAAKPNAWVLVGKETTVSQPSLIFEHDGGGIRNIAGDITHYSFLTVSPAYNTAITIEGTVSGLHGQYKEGQTVNGTYSFSYSGIDPEAIENGKSVHLCTRVWYNAEDLEKLGIKIIGQWDYGCVWISHNSPKSGEYSFTFPERGEDSLFPVKDDIYVVYELTIDAVGNGEIYLYTTYHFQWNGKPMKEEAVEGVVEEAKEEVEEAVEEESAAEESTAEALVNWVKEWLEKEGEDVHTDEAETVIRDIVAGLLAGGAAAAAAGGAAGGGAGGAPFGGETPDGGGEGPEGGMSEEEREWERQMEEYKKWEKGKFDKYTRKNPDGTISVTDPSTGKTSVMYPKEGGGYENENGTTYSDNDLANWLDDRERNSDYYKQNAATAEKNLEKMRKDAADEQARVRRGEKSDMEKAWEKRKKEIEDARKKEEIGQKKDYYDQLADKYKLDKNSADLKKDIKKAILKERLKALEDLKDAEAKDDAYTKAMQYTKRVQAVCDISFAAIGTFGGTTGKTGQTIYVLLRNTLGRTSESYSKKDSLLKGATKGAVEGGLEVGVGLIDNPIVNTAAAGIKQAYSSWLDGDSLGDAAAKIATACALQGASNVIGNWVTSGQKSFVQDQWKLSYGDAPGAGAMYLEGVDNAVKVALTVGKGVKFVGETFVDLLGRYIEGDE